MAKILFIDDDTQTLALMEKVAEILGHNPILCSNAGDAVQYAVIFRPDLVLIDINMQLNGFEIVRQIRNYKQISKIPILILSAGEAETEEGNALRAGANGFLSKPLTINVLDNAVTKFAKTKKAKK